jgi:hypothetical protein
VPGVLLVAIATFAAWSVYGPAPAMAFALAKGPSINE